MGREPICALLDGKLVAPFGIKNYWFPLGWHVISPFLGWHGIFFGGGGVVQCRFKWQTICPNLEKNARSLVLFRRTCHISASDHLLMTIYYWWNLKPDLSYGDRAFCKAAPRLWNRLPRDSRHIKSINGFKFHSRHICSKLLLICNYIRTHVMYCMCFSWFYHNAVVRCFWAMNTSAI